ncbi:MAG: RAD55 family ATPase, partial [Candidatus Nanohaloarchaea archaeon]
MSTDTTGLARASTGAESLDEILRGGYPAGRTTLLTGTPGTGKSTLAMQFLQAGLDEGERCLYISTEQTTDELRDTFAPFDFDIDHDDLAITTIQALPEGGPTGSDLLQLRTLEGGGPLDDQQVEFTADNLLGYLERGGSADRVVVDSITGLNVMTDERNVFRRAVLQLIRLFNDDYGATALFTAEQLDAGDREGVEVVGPSDTLQYTAHGVIRVWREAIEGEYHRFIDVMKMRGVDHDTRQYEMTFGPGGLKIIPRKRAHSEDFIEHNQLTTGIPGLDKLTGGGLLQGTGTVLEHDGNANFDALVAALIKSALEQDFAVGLVPTVDLSPRRFDQFLNVADADLRESLDADRLFVLDMTGAWDLAHRNVLDVGQADAGMRYLLRTVDDRAAGEHLLSIVNTEAKLQQMSEQEAQNVRYWQEANLCGPEDVLFDIHNPHLMSDELAEFHNDAAGQVFRTWLADSGMQYLKLQK